MNAMRYQIGSPTRCVTGEVCGDVVRVHVEPRTGVLSHLVVAPPRGAALRLVPMAHAGARAWGVELSCTPIQFSHFKEAPPHPGAPAALDDAYVAVIGRGQPVRATNGSAGRFRGLIVDGMRATVTHALVDEGHLWWHKTVAIPAGVLQWQRDGSVRVGLDKGAVKRLPRVNTGFREFL